MLRVRGLLRVGLLAASVGCWGCAGPRSQAGGPASASHPQPPIAHPQIEARRAPTPEPGTAHANQASPDDALDVPPPGRSGPCPEASRKQKQLFANAYRLATDTSATEPPRAVLEVLRLRLDALFQAGCGDRLRGDQLLTQLRRLTNDADIRAGVFLERSQRDFVVGSHIGAGHAVALMSWRKGKIRIRAVIARSGPEIEDDPIVLATKLVRQPETGEPVLVLALTHGWYSSCWRSLRFRAIAPGGDVHHPKVLLDRTDFSGQYCEGVKLTGSAQELTFSYLDWWDLFDDEKPQPRDRWVRFVFEGGQYREAFGFGGRPHHLVEDWVVGPWEVAREATLPSEVTRLKALHDELAAMVDRAKRRSGAESTRFTREIFPEGKNRLRVVVYCALERDAKQRCRDWPKPVDLYLQRAHKQWLVRDVRPRG